MSNKAINWALKIPLKGGYKSVLFILSNAFNEDDVCWPKMDTLIEWTGYPERTLSRYLNALIDNKIINRNYKHNHQGHRKEPIFTPNYNVQIEQISNKILHANMAGRQNNEQTLDANMAGRHCTKNKLPANMADLPANMAASTIEPSINPKTNSDVFFDEKLNSKKNKQNAQNALWFKFEQLWKLWPIKKSRERAWKIFKNLFKKWDDQLFIKILKATIAQNQEREAKSKTKEFCPSPKYLATWLNEKCWNDEIYVQSQKQNNTYTECRRCKKKILKTLALGGYCENCSDELFPPKSLSKIIDLTKQLKVAHG